jgi:hypothetical protein
MIGEWILTHLNGMRTSVSDIQALHVWLECRIARAATNVEFEPLRVFVLAMRKVADTNLAAANVYHHDASCHANMDHLHTSFWKLVDYPLLATVLISLPTKMVTVLRDDGVELPDHRLDMRCVVPRHGWVHRQISMPIGDVDNGSSTRALVVRVQGYAVWSLQAMAAIHQELPSSRDIVIGGNGKCSITQEMCIPIEV